MIYLTIHTRAIYLIRQASVDSGIGVKSLIFVLQRYLCCCYESNQYY